MAIFTILLHPLRHPGALRFRQEKIPKPEHSFLYTLNSVTDIRSSDFPEIFEKIIILLKTRRFIRQCLSLRRRESWFFSWFFSGSSIQHTIANLQHPRTKARMQLFVRGLFEVVPIGVDPSMTVDEGAAKILSAFVIAVTNPDSRLWSPACLLYTRFVLCLLRPYDGLARVLLVSALEKFRRSVTDEFERTQQAPLTEHYIDLSASLLGPPEGSLSALNQQIWHAATIYSKFVRTIEPLARKHDRSNPIPYSQRVLSLHQNMHFHDDYVPGPLTIEASDRSLLLILHGKHYSEYLATRCILSESFDDNEEWVEPYYNFITKWSETVTSILQKSKSTDAGPSFALPNDTSELLSDVFCNKVITSYCVYVLNHAKTLKVAEVSKQLVHEYNIHCKETLLLFLDLIEQHLLDLKSDDPIVYNAEQENLAMTSDLSLGCSGSLISIMSYLSEHDISNPHAMAQKIVSFCPSLICQLPSPEYTSKLAGCSCLHTLQYLRLSLRTRELIFLSLILDDVDSFEIAITEELEKDLASALQELPLYLDTPIISHVAEKVCMVISAHAPMDFDNLDKVYEQVAMIMVLRDERIEFCVSSLRECIVAGENAKTLSTFDDGRLRERILDLSLQFYDLSVCTWMKYAEIFRKTLKSDAATSPLVDISYDTVFGEGQLQCS